MSSPPALSLQNVPVLAPKRSLDALVEAMHAMAQPLTVLQATLELAAGNASSMATYQRAIDSALIEVSRVLARMDFARELLRIVRDVPEVATLDVRAVLATVHEDLRCVLDDAGTSLRVSVEENAQLFPASESELRQCLFYLVQQALRESKSGESLGVRVSGRESEVEIVVRSELSSACNSTRFALVHDLTDCERLSMVLADALAAVQGGNLQYQMLPFEARLTFPTLSPTKVPRDQVPTAPNPSLTGARAACAESLEAGPA